MLLNWLLLKTWLSGRNQRIKKTIKYLKKTDSRARLTERANPSPRTSDLWTSVSSTEAWLKSEAILKREREWGGAYSCWNTPAIGLWTSTFWGGKSQALKPFLSFSPSFSWPLYHQLETQAGWEHSNPIHHFHHGADIAVEQARWKLEARS